MQSQAFLRQLLVAMLLALSVNVGAQRDTASPEQALNNSARAAVIDALLKKIDSIYIFPDIAKKMGQTIRRRQANKEYDGITSGAEFAKVLTDHLREVCKDRHLEVEYSAKTVSLDPTKPTAEEIARFRERGRRRNYEFRRCERLDGGIGLLQVDGFYPGEWMGDTLAAAMSFLGNSEAIILDLRYNTGGFGNGGTLLCSYFFEEETHLTDSYNRSENTTRQVWTFPIVPRSRLVDKELYILTSNKSFSAAEALAYDMQALKRAIIVGETTGGGAHGTTIYKITDHFTAAIPFNRGINPVTKTDWEGVGVKPDVAVPANQALLTAHLMALKKALKRHSDDSELVDSLQRTIEEKEKELKAMKAPLTTP
jgi:retinol-binding protein 3